MNFAKAFLSFLALVMTGTLLSRPVVGQQLAPAPLPPVHYASWADDNPSANPAQPAGAAASSPEGEGQKEKKENELDFLEKNLNEISQTQVKAGSAALSSEINTVSRTTQPLARTPSAVYVVTNEMIRRCGARNIPEVLRTVPGVNVARINASAWAISIRGLNGHFAKNLLVQIDGVAIYSPTHSGVFWEREYVMLEDVERIEVIRGPGAAVWGVNAVNGVINIVTKSATATHGVYADGGVGQNNHRQFGDFRVGGQSGNVHWRAYGMGMQDDPSLAPMGIPAVDESSMAQGGFRMDWTPSRRDTLTVQGDFYRGISNQDGYSVFTPAHTMRCSTSTILTRWARTLDEDTDWAVQLYYWDPYATNYNVNSVSTFDLDYQYHLNRGRHDVVWGFGYRNYDERWVSGDGTLAPQDSEQIPSYFVQDTIALVDDRFFVTLGSKFDHNSVTDFEYQPTVRLAWTPDEKTSIWGAISRASRVPSLIERIFTLPEAEHVLAYEIGVRRQPTERFFWEFATFFNRYDNLLAYQQQRWYYNPGKADTYGFELNGTYTLTERWRLTAWYAFLVQDADVPTGWTSNSYPGAFPRNEAYIQSGWDLGRNVSLDVMFRYVDALVNAPYFNVDDYFAADIRLAWRPTTRLEMAVVGQNLLCGDHFEYTFDAGCWPTEVQPAVYGIVSWRY